MTYSLHQLIIFPIFLASSFFPPLASSITKKCRERPPAPALVTDVWLVDVEKNPRGFEIQRPKYGVLDMLDGSKGESVGFSNTQEKFTSEKRSWGYHLELLTSWCISQKTGQLFGRGESRKTSLSLIMFEWTTIFQRLGNAWNSRVCSRFPTSLFLLFGKCWSL